MSKDFDPLDPAAQEAAASLEVEAQRLRREQEVNDFRTLMGTKEGRRFMWRLLSVTGVFKVTFDPNHAIHAFADGNRNFGLLMFSEITSLCPEKFQLMQKEYRDDERRRSPTRK